MNLKRIFYRSAKCVFAIICACLLISGSGSTTALAEDDLLELASTRSPKMTPQMLDEIGQVLRIPPQSKFRKVLEENIRKGEHQTDAGGEDAPAAGDQKSLPIIKHVRSNKGVPFPNYDEIKMTNHVSEKQIQAALEKYVESIFNYTEVITAPPVPPCTENRTVPQQTGYTGTDPKIQNKVLYDMLFIKEGKLPLNPDTIFGERVRVIPYTAKRPDGVSWAASRMKVTCLPTRFRGTSQVLYRDEGLNALRNYDENFHSAGKLHDVVSEYPELFK